jgi:PHYB activation tagged suppressor 1
LYWNGTAPNLFLGDVNVVRHVLFDRTGLYPKNLMNPHLCRLLGKGIVLTTVITGSRDENGSDTDGYCGYR